jgi:hypothetical protein
MLAPFRFSSPGETNYTIKNHPYLSKGGLIRFKKNIIADPAYNSPLCAAQIC